MEQHETETQTSADMTLVYIAKKLKEALALEEIFAAADLEYHVEPDTYRGGIIFASERIGAFFYVDPENVERAHQVLRSRNFKPHQV